MPISKERDIANINYYFFLIAVSLTPLQIYTIPIRGFYPSISIMAAYACFILIPFYRTSPRHKHLLPLVAMLLWMTGTLPLHQEKTLLIKIIFYNIPFVALFISGYYISAHREDWHTPFYFAIAFSAVNALLVLTFRTLPHLEQHLYHLSIAKLFINPNRVDYILKSPELTNAFIDYRKSGGFFPNANYGAVFSGISCLASYGLYKAKSNNILFIAALLFISAMLASGSKPAYIAAPCITLFMFIKEKKLYRILLITCFLASLSLSLSTTGKPFKQDKPATMNKTTAQVQKMITYHANNTIANYDTRLALWEYSLDLISKRPLFGSSPNQLEKIGGELFKNMQPHNTYLKVGVYFGIPALILAMLFHIGMLRAIWKAKYNVPTQYRCFALCTFLSFGLMVAQGLVSNAEPTGEFHSAALLAGMCGITLGLASPQVRTKP
ncbi:MAG: O-antigen ligase family protein [Halodesulfovibrio sp.]